MTAAVTAAQALDRYRRLDAGPGAGARIGAILLATDLVSEEALRAMRGEDASVAFFSTRLRNANPTTIENLTAHAGEIARAAACLLPGTTLDVVIYGCTSGAIVLGDERVEAEIRSERPGVPVTNPAAAIRAALAALGVSRFALLTPYLAEVNEVFVSHFEATGHRVTALASFGMADDAEMARLPPEALVEAGAAMVLGDAEALVISCTALRAVEAVAPLEAALGLPVVTSHQALLWHALRLAGDTRPRPRYGRLWTR